MTDFPRPIEGGNEGDGMPLLLGDPDQIGDLYAGGGGVAVLDWDGDGTNEVVVVGQELFTYRLTDRLADGTPVVGRGLRWGEVSRTPQRDESDAGLCGSLLTTGDFDGDGTPEMILAPRGYSRVPTVVLQLKGGPPKHRSQGLPFTVVDPTLPEGEDPIYRWRSRTMASIDWDGDGRLDLIMAHVDNEGYSYLDPATGNAPEDQRDRYHRDGRWKGRQPGHSLHLLRNTGDASRPTFTYVGPAAVEIPAIAHAIGPVDPSDPGAGLLLLGYYGEVWHLPLIEAGATPAWGEPVELMTLHGAPFTRSANFTSIAVGSLEEQGRLDIFASDISGSLYWCRYYGQDGDGRPIYDTPKKVKQRNPHVNGGSFSVPTVGDWRGTGTPDLLVGSVEGYIFWYKTLSTDPLRFAPPERVRRGDEEIRRYAKPNPAGGHHWGSSQGPGDGYNGGYSNPVLVDWDGNGLLDLLVSDMNGLYDWYPNWGTTTEPELGHPRRLHVSGEPLFGPWRQQAGVRDFTGDGLPDIGIQDLDLDLALYRRAGRDDPTALLPGEKLRYEDGETIKTHGVYTAGGGDGRGGTKIQVVDWDKDGTLDLVLGVGPQGGSPYPGSYVLFCDNAGTNSEPVFQRPVVLIYASQGKPLEHWRHGAHPVAVDMDGDGEWELMVGADKGYVWYYKPEHFGTPRGGRVAPPDQPDDFTRPPQ